MCIVCKTTTTVSKICNNFIFFAQLFQINFFWLLYDICHNLSSLKIIYFKECLHLLLKKHIFPLSLQRLRYKNIATFQYFNLERIKSFFKHLGQHHEYVKTQNLKNIFDFWTVRLNNLYSILRLVRKLVLTYSFNVIFLYSQIGLCTFSDIWICY